MGNVLVYFSHQKMCGNIAELSGLSEDQVRQFLMDEGRQWALERGELSEEQLLEELSRQSGRVLKLDDLRHAAANIFWLNESIVPVLQELKTAGIRLVLLSNTSVTHVRFIEQNFRVLDYMDDRVMSFEVGAMKPDPAIFHAALAKAGCAPEECFYTDDIQPYIDQAAALGIHSHPYTTTELLRQALHEHGVL